MQTRAAASEPGFTDGIELFETANLPPEDTGVPGVIYISSQEASHAGRVNWFPHAPKSRNDPCLSVTIEQSSRAFNQNLPGRVAATAADPVKAWVALNHGALADFWDHGYSWTRQQVSAFIDGLQKL